MKPRFDQPSSPFKNNAQASPPPTQKESLANQRNGPPPESRITFGESSPASKTYECQWRLNTNGLQDCSQYARKDEYPFYTGRGTNTEDTLPIGSGQAGRWQDGSCGQSQRMNVCQRINDDQQATSGQRTDGQQDASASRQLDGREAFQENIAKLCLESQEERATSSRKQSCRFSSPAACVAPGVPIPMPQPKVTCIAPPFEGTAVYKGEFHEVKLSDYRGRYLCLLFYPLDFTFVCPTEILAMSDLHDQFKEVNCAVLGCSCDSPYTHLAFMKTPRANDGLGDIAFPLLSDFKKKISASYNVLTDDGSPERALFIIDPLGIIRSITINDAGVGRNTDEVLRMVQAIKRVDDFDEMCPHGWMPGSASIPPTRHGALNYYRQMYSQKNDRRYRKQDEVEACSTHIACDQEQIEML